MQDAGLRNAVLQKNGFGRADHFFGPTQVEPLEGLPGVFVFQHKVQGRFFDTPKQRLGFLLPAKGQITKKPIGIFIEETLDIFKVHGIVGATVPINKDHPGIFGLFQGGSQDTHYRGYTATRSN